MSKENVRKRSNKKTSIIVAAVIVLLVFIYDISGFGGNIRFYGKWAECGVRPLQSGILYTGRIPHYVDTPIFSLMRLSPAYFCSPREAELGGYSANPQYYEFPHLSKEEWKRAVEMKIY